MEKSELEKFRTRWRKWLGNKTRIDKPYWVTLLASDWAGWANDVRMNNGMEYAKLGMFSDRLYVKDVFTEAIDVANMDDLLDLDELYNIDKYNL